MTIITRPLDAAVAHQLSTISAWAAEELAARIAAKGIAARTGYSGQSCSTYVDADDICVRISDHDAMSYNRAGDFAISLRPDRFADAHAYVRATKIYDAEIMTPIDFDEDGEPMEYEISYFETDNENEDGAEFKGWRVEMDSLIAAIDAAQSFMEARLA